MGTILVLFFGLLNSLAIFLFPNQIKKPAPLVSVTRTVIIPTKNIVPENNYPLPTPDSRFQIQDSNNVPWGTTEKLGEHLYRTYVGADEKMGTPQEILAALNNYRKNHGVGTVREDENICKLAKQRAEEQNTAGGLDGHKGFSEFMAKEDSWPWLDVKAAGENASYGYVLSGVHLIEWVFNADVEHRDNQLNPAWNLACAAVSGTTVDIVFGQR
jgi:uncharacterized protein YkwD